jgi:hypothetical protein
MWYLRTVCAFLLAFVAVNAAPVNAQARLDLRPPSSRQLPQFLQQAPAAEPPVSCLRRMAAPSDQLSRIPRLVSAAGLRSKRAALSALTSHAMAGDNKKARI